LNLPDIDAKLQDFPSRSNLFLCVVEGWADRENKTIRRFSADLAESPPIAVNAQDPRTCHCHDVLYRLGGRTIYRPTKGFWELKGGSGTSETPFITGLIEFGRLLAELIGFKARFA
jgi:hypothetical protein